MQIRIVFVLNINLSGKFFSTSDVRKLLISTRIINIWILFLLWQYIVVVVQDNFDIYIVLSIIPEIFYITRQEMSRGSCFAALCCIWLSIQLTHISQSYVSLALVQCRIHANFISLWDICSIKRQHLFWHHPITFIHLPVDRMVAFSETKFLNTFARINSNIFWLKFHWSSFLRVQLK